MAFLQQACLLVLVVLCGITGHVHATGKAPGVIAIDGIFPGRLQGINVQAVFDMGGVRGYVQFVQPNPSSPVQIHVNLQGLDQFSENYPWHVHDFPVRNALLRDYPCSDEEVGGHYDPRNAMANPNYATECNQNNPTACEIGDFSNKLGYLRNDRQWQVFEDPNLNLYGPESIVGRSLVIHRGILPENRWICANIEYLGAHVDILRATLVGRGGEVTYQGDVIIHKVAGRDDATIYVDVWRNDTTTDISIGWSLRLGRATPTCAGYPVLVYGHQSGFVYSGCSTDNQRACAVGELSAKCGSLNFESGRSRRRLFCTDNQLGSIRTSDLFNKFSSQPVSVVLDDGGLLVACGEVEGLQPQVAQVEFTSPTIFGQITFYQASPNDRTYARAHITGIRNRNVSLQILNNGDGTCESSNFILRRPGPLTTPIGRPVGAVKTGDAVVLGNLGTKVNIPPNLQSYRATTSTAYLPLFGPYSIANNTLALVANNEKLACGAIKRWNDYPTGIAASILGYQDEHPYNK